MSDPNTPLFDTIGRGYAALRRPDPRIERSLHEALGRAHAVLNVGAGAGSYEPRDRALTALEPSQEMIGQRPPDAAPVIQGVVEALPFDDEAFDASMAVLTVHHWADVARGLTEMRRVTRGPVVIFSFDPSGPYFWLKDYVPEIVEIDQPRMPKLDVYAKYLGPVEIRPIPIPHDCTDGFLGAYWRRPEAYLDAKLRSAISTFVKLGDLRPQLDRLKDDVQTGAWQQRYGHVLGLDELDIGYRLIVAGPRRHHEPIDGP